MTSRSSKIITAVIVALVFAVAIVLGWAAAVGLDSTLAGVIVGVLVTIGTFESMAAYLSEEERRGRR